MSDGATSAQVADVITGVLLILVGGGGGGLVGKWVTESREKRAAAKVAAAAARPDSPERIAYVQTLADKVVESAGAQVDSWREDAATARSDAAAARGEAAEARAESGRLRTELGELRSLVEQLTRVNGAQQRHIEALEGAARADGRPVPEWPSPEELSAPLVSHERRVADVPHEGPERRRP